MLQPEHECATISPRSGTASALRVYWIARLKKRSACWTGPGRSRYDRAMAWQTIWSAARRCLFWAIPVTLVATLVWMLVPRGRSAPPTQEAVERFPDNPPYAQIQRGDLQGTDDAGHEQWRIAADSFTVVQNKEVVILRNVRATFYEKGGGTITVTGAEGRYDTKARKVEIEGHVHGRSSNGRELFADRLRWEQESGKITGAGHIRLLQESVTMYADQMISDTTLGQTRFFGHVHGAVR